MTDRNTCPFDVNDLLYISDSGGAKNGEELLGTIVGFYIDVGNRVNVSYVPDRNQGVGLVNNHARNASQVYVISCYKCSNI